MHGTEQNYLVTDNSIFCFLCAEQTNTRAPSIIMQSATRFLVRLAEDIDYDTGERILKEATEATATRVGNGMPYRRMYVDYQKLATASPSFS